MFEPQSWFWDPDLCNSHNRVPATYKYLLVELSQALLYNVFLCSWYPTKNGTVLQYDV